MNEDRKKYNYVFMFCYLLDFEDFGVLKNEDATFLLPFDLFTRNLIYLS